MVSQENKVSPPDRRSRLLLAYQQPKSGEFWNAKMASGTPTSTVSLLQGTIDDDTAMSEIGVLLLINLKK